MSSEGLDFEDVPEDYRWDMFGVLLGILQDAGYDLNRFTDGELRRAAALEYDASVVSTYAWLGHKGPQAATEERGGLKGSFRSGATTACCRARRKRNWAKRSKGGDDAVQRS